MACLIGHSHKITNTVQKIIKNFRHCNPEKTYAMKNVPVSAMAVFEDKFNVQKNIHTVGDYVMSSYL